MDICNGRKRMAETFHGVVTLACLTAPTFGAGLKPFLRFRPARILYLNWRGRHIDRTFPSEETPRNGLRPVRRLLIKMPLIVTHANVRVMHMGAMMDGRNVPPTRTECDSKTSSETSPASSAVANLRASPPQCSAKVTTYESKPPKRCAKEE